MSRRVHVDANVILRFLRNDDPEQSPIAAGFFNRTQEGSLKAIVSPVTVAEVFYVLASTYAMPRPEVAKVLLTFLTSDLVSCEDKGVAVDALTRITSNRISFGDAYLVASANLAGEELASFDKGISALKDVRLYPLPAAAKARGK